MCLTRGAGAQCDFSPVGVEWRYYGMLPKAVIGALASQMGGQLLCLGGILNVGV